MWTGGALGKIAWMLHLDVWVVIVAVVVVVLLLLLLLLPLLLLVLVLLPGWVLPVGAHGEVQGWPLGHPDRGA